MGSCRTPSWTEAKSPEEVVERLRTNANAGDWRAYWELFSDRGKGWFIGEVATVAAYGAYAQPIDPKAGEKDREFIKKYGLQKDRIQRREEESIDEACRRVARELGDRGPEFLKEVFQSNFRAFPGDGSFRILEQSGDRAVLILPQDLRCSFVKIEGHWYVDGHFPD